MRRLPILVVAGAIALAACGDKSQITTSASVSADSQAAKGNEVMRSEGCLGCHTVDGTKGSGPTLKGVAGSQVQLADGRTITADDAYLRRSILEPDADTVKGFHKGVMASVIDHRRKLTLDQINEVVAYIDTLK